MRENLDRNFRPRLSPFLVRLRRPDRQAVRATRVTGPLEVGDQRGQGRPDQAAALDPRWERGLVELLATRAPSRMAAMLLDRQRHLADVDLLDHPGRDGV